MMDLLERLNRDGLTVIIITHSNWVVEDYAHRVVRMREGRIEADG
jgi:energy-coupling factor transport system ATP-binding protein